MAKIPKIPWTTKEEDILKLLIGKGHDFDSICPVFPKRTPDAIKQKVYSMGLHYQPPEPEIDYALLGILGVAVNESGELVDNDA